jgi:hypothetical protein
MTRHLPKGLDNRMRDEDGEIRKKRSDTLVRTLRNEYGEKFAQGRGIATSTISLSISRASVTMLSFAHECNRRANCTRSRTSQ